MKLARLLALSSEELSLRGLSHTPHEILQQPRTWLDTLARLRALQPRLARLLAEQGVPDGEGPSTLLVGVGSSHLVGQTVANWLRGRWQCPVEAIATTELATHEHALLSPNVPYLGVSFSRSGSNPDAVETLERLLARAPCTPQVTVTCSDQGVMATRFRDDPRVLGLVLDDHVNDRGLTMTSAYTNLVLAGLGLANWADLDNFESVVQALVEAWQRLLVPADLLAEQLAARTFSGVQFLGSGPLRAVARESASKVHELTFGQLPSTGDSFLNLRQGHFRALNGRTLVVALLSSAPSVRCCEVEVLQQLRHQRLASELVVLAQDPGPELRRLGAFMLHVDTPGLLAAEYLAPVMALFGQLLGLHGAVSRGLRPDTLSPLGLTRRLSSVGEATPRNFIPPTAPGV